MAFATSKVLSDERTNVAAKTTNMIRRDIVFFIKND